MHASSSGEHNDARRSSQHSGSKLNCQSERNYVRQNSIIGDEAAGRLEEFARQMDEKAAALAGTPDANIETTSDHSNRSQTTMSDNQPADPNERGNRIRERAYHLWEA